MLYYYVYQIKQISTGKVYVGAHRTYNLDDGYMGSGNLIKRAIKKHGVSDFKKEILKFFESEVEMYEYEAEIVNEEFYTSERTFNLACGGTGGTISTNRKSHCKPHTDVTKEKIRLALTGRTLSKETKDKISEKNKLTNYSRGRKVSEKLKGKPKTEEHKNNIRLALMSRSLK